MGRPKYEREADLIGERRIADRWEKKFGCKCSKLPYSYHLDYVCTRDEKIVALLEIKCRKDKIEKYDTHMVSAKKVQHARELSNLLGVPAFICFRYDDSISYIDLSEEPDFYKRWGRMKSDRDGQDIEIMAFWQKERFHNL